MAVPLIMQNVTVEGRIIDLSTSLESGAITAICGPNGAGKSTALSAMAGLIQLDRGEAALGSASIARLHPRERGQRIGFLPQHGEVAWDVTVRNLVALGRLPHGDAGSEMGMKHVEAAINALNIGPFSDRPVSQLSGGERARALLARVLAGEPEWLLADEPLAALDLRHQLDLLRHLRREVKASKSAQSDQTVQTEQGGRGIVLVLHDLALAMNHADRVIVLDQGRVIADGPPNIALSQDIIERVWGVPARWIGDRGAQALIPG